MGNRTLILDIEAMRQTNGTTQQILLAEVKCFGRNTTVELYIAIGQYIIYQAALLERGESIPLHLAIPQHIYEVVFEEVVQRAIRDHHIKLMIVNIETEEIVQWIE